MSHALGGVCFFQEIVGKCSGKTPQVPDLMRRRRARRFGASRPLLLRERAVLALEKDERRFFVSLRLPGGRPCDDDIVVPCGVD